MKLKIKNTIRFEILKYIKKYKEKLIFILITLDDISIILDLSFIFENIVNKTENKEEK